jgi:trehalose 6-phosphate phosphatase
MIPLFSKSGLTVLESLSFTNTFYAFDFDGTLAKIVRNPSDAYMTETTRALIEKLSTLVPLAIVSGRSVQDLKERIGFKPRYLIGNHGVEGLSGQTGSLGLAKTISTDWISELRQVDFDSCVEVEDKGYSVALHYRKCRNKVAVRDQLRSVIDGLKPTPRIITGKAVFNLLPPGSPHKGAAVVDLIRESQTKHVFYVGDDDTDEDVFSMPYPDGQLMSVRIGKKRSSRAKYYLERQSDMNRLLRTLIRFHSPVSERTGLDHHG